MATKQGVRSCDYEKFAARRESRDDACRYDPRGTRCKQVRVTFPQRLSIRCQVISVSNLGNSVCEISRVLDYGSPRTSRLSMHAHAAYVYALRYLHGCVIVVVAYMRKLRTACMVTRDEIMHPYFMYELQQ